MADIVQALTQQANYQAARNYWKVLKNRLKNEGSEVVTNCNRLKMRAQDRKLRATDVATAETLLRLVQSVPSPKAEPIKLWLAKVGYASLLSTIVFHGLGDDFQRKNSPTVVPRISKKHKICLLNQLVKWGGGN